MHTLLIVEDEKMIRQGIKAMVQRSGVPVDNILECNNGEMALEILKMQKIDVMFTDIRMPKLDGIGLVREAVLLKHVPLIVAVSGYDDFSYAVEMLRMGVREYILKPVDREKVRQVLEKLNRELQKEHESEKKDRSLSKKQLKYALLSENPLPEEMSYLQQTYTADLFSQPFHVICTAAKAEALFADGEEPPFLYLNHLEQSDLYITTAKYLPVLQKRQLDAAFAGISGEHIGMGELKTAYREALSARKRAFYLNREEGLFFSQELLREDGHHLEDGTAAQLVQLLGTDKFEDALRQMERIFGAAGRGSFEPEEVEREIEAFMGQLEEIYADVKPISTEERGKFLEPYRYPCLQAYQKDFMTWIRGYGEQLNLRLDDYKNRQKIQMAVQYIQENYNRDLNMAVVSNHISMNYSLFSFVFKQYTGNNFVNYLKQIRIEEAKRLLQNSDMKILEISKRVGYENEKHFMKTFKAICGVSPTEYRRNMQLKG